MRKLICGLLFLMVGFFVSVDKVDAQACTNWCNCSYYYSTYLDSWVNQCDCCDGGGTSTACPSGYYPCLDGSLGNCCPIGSSSSCTGTLECKQDGNCTGTTGAACGTDIYGNTKYECCTTGGTSPYTCGPGEVLATVSPTNVLGNLTQAQCYALWPSVWNINSSSCYDTGKASLGTLKHHCPCLEAACVCNGRAPDQPQLIYPNDGADLSNPSVQLYWNAILDWGEACPNLDPKYKIYVEAGDSTPDVLLADVAANTTNTTFTGSYNQTYYWQVVADNGSYTTASQIWSFTIGGGVRGNVYYDPTNQCLTTTGSNVGGGLSVDLRGSGYTDNVGSDGSFSLLAPSGVYNYLDLVGVPSQYVCSAGCGTQSCSVCGDTVCPTITGVTSPQTGYNFFLTDYRVSWWQAVGAGVYAGSEGGGETIYSELPGSNSRLILASGGLGEAAAVRASGSVNAGSGQVNDNNISVESSYRGKTMDYRFFANQMGVTPGNTDDFGSTILSKGVIAGQNKDFYLSSQGAEVSLDSDWAVTAGESYVVFVNGDLRIPSDVTVEEGGFLAFIVNGSVTIEPSVVGVQGIYVMDGQLTSQAASSGDDVQVVFEGMNVAWGGVSLGRDLGAFNLSTPAEQFIYRPDLLVNMPEKMKSFSLRWQEVAPGTFD